MGSLSDLDHTLGIHSPREVLILKSLEHFRNKSSLAFLWNIWTLEEETDENVSSLLVRVVAES